MLTKRNIGRMSICALILLAMAILCTSWSAMLPRANAETEELSNDTGDINNDAKPGKKSGDVIDNTEPAITEMISYLLVELSNEELVEQSHLIVRGQVTSISPAFKIEATGGGTLIFTDYTISVKEVYRGKDVNEVIVRQEGGQVGDQKIICENTPVLDVGKEFIFFLYQPSLGVGFDTGGDYYKINGVNQGLFAVEETAGTMMVVAEDGGEKTSLQTLAQEIEALDQEYPVNYNWEREEMIENMKANLESGFITKEESEQMLAELYQYAKIVEE